jgi:signal transduction histidine kinase
VGRLPTPGRRGLLLDATLAAALLALTAIAGVTSEDAGVTILEETRPADAGYFVLAILQALPVALRRVAPIPAFLVSGVAYAVDDFLGYPAVPGNIGICIIAFTVAKYAPARRLWPAVAALVVVGGMDGAANAVAGPAEDALGNVIGSYVVPLVPWLIGFAQRSRVLYLDQLEVRAEELFRQRQEVEHALGEERLRIARELHDVVAHGVTGMVVQAEAARYLLRSSPERADESLERIAGAGRQALDELRTLLDLVRRADADAGRHGDAPTPTPGALDLDALVEQARAAGQAVELVVDGDRRSLPPAVATSLGRIVQEALTNAVKHAAGSRVSVRVAYGPDDVEVVVGDTGGARTSWAPAPGGYGLMGMRERVELFGGSFAAGPTAAGGWRVHAVLPAAAARPPTPAAPAGPAAPETLTAPGARPAPVSP